MDRVMNNQELITMNEGFLATKGHLRNDCLRAIRTSFGSRYSTLLTMPLPVQAVVYDIIYNSGAGNWDNAYVKKGWITMLIDGFNSGNYRRAADYITNDAWLKKCSTCNIKWFPNSDARRATLHQMLYDVGPAAYCASGWPSVCVSFTLRNPRTPHPNLACRNPTPVPYHPVTLRWGTENQTGCWQHE
jgi:hypothetical protein